MATPPDAQPRRRGRPPKLAQHDVLAAAVATIDEVGVEACTMAAIAARLDVTPMALYRHADGKAQLLEMIPDFLIGQFMIDPADATDGADALRRCATTIINVLDAHPNCGRLLATPTVGPVMIGASEAIVGKLVHDGHPPEQAGALMRATAAFAIGLGATDLRDEDTGLLVPLATQLIETWLAGVAAGLH